MSRLAILVIVLLTLMSIPSVFAQQPPRDGDGDGVLDNVDSCPNAAGPSSNSGCPVSTENSGGGGAVPTERDRDGDNVPNDSDGCPDTFGAQDNFGCPREIPTPAPAENNDQEQVNLPALPTDGDCVVATAVSEGVNARQYPHSESEIMGRLDPRYLYLASFILQLGDETWVLSENGWVAGWVTRLGGDCTEETAPAFQSLAIGNTDLLKILIGLLLPANDWGDPHNPEEPLDLSAIFGDGSVMPQTKEHILLAKFDANGLAEGAIIIIGKEGGKGIGLLLPAVQKVREAAMCDGSVMPAGDPIPTESFFGDGSVLPADGFLDCTQGILIGLSEEGFGLLLPASEVGFDPQPDPPGEFSLLLPYLPNLLLPASDPAAATKMMNLFSPLDWVGLNPQPLPPKEISLSDKMIIAISEGVLAVCVATPDGGKACTYTYF